MAVTIKVEGMDWDLLHEQKYRLIQLLNQVKADRYDPLWGLVFLIDDLQDRAAKQGLWAFPEDTHKEEK